MMRIPARLLPEGERLTPEFAMRTASVAALAACLALATAAPLAAQGGYTIHVSPTSQGPDPRRLPRDVIGESRARVRGEVRSYRDVLRYRCAGDDFVYAPQRESFSRWRRRHADESTSSFTLSLGGTYNRIEGVPIVFGPNLNFRLSDG